jgi:hypothetical protein
MVLVALLLSVAAVGVFDLTGAEHSPLTQSPCRATPPTLHPCTDEDARSGSLSATTPPLPPTEALSETPCSWTPGSVQPGSLDAARWPRQGASASLGIRAARHLESGLQGKRRVEGEGLWEREAQEGRGGGAGSLGQGPLHQPTHSPFNAFLGMRRQATPTAANACSITSSRPEWRASTSITTRRGGASRSHMARFTSSLCPRPRRTPQMLFARGGAVGHQRCASTTKRRAPALQNLWKGGKTRFSQIGPKGRKGTTVEPITSNSPLHSVKRIQRGKGN